MVQCNLVFFLVWFFPLAFPISYISFFVLLVLSMESSVIVVCVIELLLMALTYVKLGGSMAPDHVKRGEKPAGSDVESSKERQEKSRRYSDHLHSSYMDAIDSTKEVNPFMNDTRYLTQSDRVWMSFMTPTVLPVRVICTLILLLCAAVYGKVAVLGLDDKAGLTEPLSAFRRSLLFPVRLMLRAILFVWSFHWIEVKGKKASSSEAPVIVPNHVTFLEPLALVYLNAPMSVGAYATMMFPGFSSLHRLLQNIPLMKYLEPNTRENVYSKEWVKDAITTRCKSKGAWPQLMIFPEGTTHSESSSLAQYMHFRELC